MKYKIFCLFFIVSVILSCTKSQIKDSLKDHFRESQYTTITIFPISLEDKEFAECVQEKLKQDLQYLKFFSGDKFREAMFPWFEPNTAPKNIKELSSLLSKILVQKRIENLGVELLVYVHGYTKEEVSALDGIVSLGAAGYRETQIRTTVWDLKEIIRVGDTDISFKGIVVGGLGYIPHLFILFLLLRKVKLAVKPPSEFLII